MPHKKIISERTAKSKYIKFLNEQSVCSNGIYRKNAADYIRRNDPIFYKVGFKDYVNQLLDEGILVRGLTD